jgi:hypothetical protein
MKKNYLLAGMAVSALMLASCTGGDDPVTSSYSCNLVNVVTSNTDGTTTASEGSYDFKYNLTDATMQMVASDVRVGSNSYNFRTSDQVRFSEGSSSQGVTTAFTASEMTATNSSVTASNLKATIYTVYNYNASLGLSTSVWRHFDINYSVNDYNVKTMESDQFFVGDTYSTYVYNEQHKEYTNSGIVYEIRFNVANNSADLYIYNAKFAEEQPSITLMKVPGLKLQFSFGKYLLEGENLIPEVMESGSYTPNPRYVFNTIRFVPSNTDLTQGALSFTVAGMFQASASLTYSL